MIAYVTFLLIVLALAFPVSFVIALIVKLFQIPRMVREMLASYQHFYRSDGKFYDELDDYEFDDDDLQ